GAVLFDGRASVTGGRFEATFVVPVSLRGGARGRLRAYAYSQGVEAVGAVDPLPIGGLSASAPVDTIAPSITIEVTAGTITPGDDLSILIEDQNGINVTQLFEFRSIILSFLDESNLEAFRADVTEDFAYDAGSYQRGRVTTRVPDVAAGSYTIRLTATDNFNNRGEARLTVSVGGAGEGGAVSNLLALPNPFESETTLVFDLEAATSQVRVLVYTVAGRRVREWSVSGVAGENRLSWDGRDSRGDPVSNGVYLVKVAAQPADGGEEIDIVEPIVRLR
ncbi:MAG TPA: FlgD immunoglobulin-like domain containing protein, partial [Candidatus Eisenbacteria bacterium]